MRRQPRAPFATFIRVLRISRGFTARYTPLGRLLIAVLLVSALFALDPNQTTAIGLFAILGAALVCAMLETWRWRPPLTVERHLPQYAVHGAAVTYQLAIHNHGQRERGLEIQDYLHDHFPTREAYTELRALHPQRDNWFDRRVGFLSWLRVARHLSGGELNAVPLEYVAADAVTTLAMTFHPARRGVLQFARIALRRPDPCNLRRAEMLLLRPQELLVLPRHHPMPAFALATAGSRAPLMRRHAGPTPGGDEFHSLREYRLGDSLRQVHWRVSAKRGVRIVKDRVDDQSDQLLVLLDSYASPRLFETLIEAAASVMVAALAQLPDAVALRVIDQRRVSATAPTGRVRETLATLARLMPAREDHFAQALRAAALPRHVPKIILTASWDSTRAALCSALLRGSQSATVLVIADAPARPLPTAPEYFLLRATELARDLAQVRPVPQASFRTRLTQHG